MGFRVRGLKGFRVLALGFDEFRAVGFGRPDDKGKGFSTSRTHCLGTWGVGFNGLTCKRVGLRIRGLWETDCRSSTRLNGWNEFEYFWVCFAMRERTLDLRPKLGIQEPRTKQAPFVVYCSSVRKPGAAKGDEGLTGIPSWDLLILVQL